MPGRACFVIVGWSPAKSLAEPLKGLRAAAREGDAILFVDNRRLAETRELLSELGDPRLRYVDPERNRGFAGAVNFGITTAGEGPFDWWVVCSDDSLLDPRFREMLDAVEGDPELGAIGPVVVSPVDGRPSFAARWVNLWTATMIDAPASAERFCETGYIEGRCLAISAKAWEQAGPFDETFFIYWEEADFCYRVRGRGWKVATDSQTHVTDTGVSAAGSRLREYLLVRNRVYFVSKHGNPLMLASTVAWVLTLRLAQAVLRPEGSHQPFAVLLDRLQGVRDGLRLVLRKPADPAVAALKRAW